MGLLLYFLFGIMLVVSPIVSLACVIHYAIKTYTGRRDYLQNPTSEYLREEWERNRFHLICSAVLLVLIPLVVVGLGVIVGNSISFM